MQTTETETGRAKAKSGLVPAREYYREKRKRWQRLQRQPPWVPGDVGTYRDRIARAVAREREQVRAAMPECETALDHVFRCVLCGRVRGDEERREPGSEVCLRCVEDAGFWN
jgi:hypothetical protein